MRFGYATARDWQRLRVPPLGEARHGCLRVVSYPWQPLAGTGLRLVFFSDLHFWRGRPERLPLLVEAINAQEPDWILFGGDLCRHLTDLQPALDGLTALRAKQGKLAVAGNRERAHCWLPPEFWPDTFDRIGFRFLSNEMQDLGPVLLAGLDDPRFGQPEPEALASAQEQDKPLLTLWHSPDGPAGATGTYVGDLVLAGHTHGGQLRLPLVGAIYTSSAYGRQFDQGWFERDDGTRLYVSTGCGETGTPWLRHRLFCPPEIVVLHPA
jgi:predicted MPP superfamily phosphohydrolase